MGDVSKMERIVTMMPSKLVQKIAVQWHKRKLPNFSETVRVLLEEALKK